MWKASYRLTLPGDTVLYLLLPLHAAVFGVSLPEAGLLLAANRLVRIAGYGWVARGYHRFGPRAACVAATFGAAAATLGYALTTGLIPLLIARLLWGLSFAALNIATQALATAEAHGASRRIRPASLRSPAQKPPRDHCCYSAAAIWARFVSKPASEPSSAAGCLRSSCQSSDSM